MTISLSGSQNLMKLDPRTYREPDKALKWSCVHVHFDKVENLARTIAFSRISLNLFKLVSLPKIIRYWDLLFY